MVCYAYYYEVHKSRPGCSCCASSKQSMALQRVAAMLLPPLRPSTMILGMVVNGFTMCFDSFTCTKPTGAAMMPAGCALPLRMRWHSSMSAVGALPKAKRASAQAATRNSVSSAI